MEFQSRLAAEKGQSIFKSDLYTVKDGYVEQTIN